MSAYGSWERLTLVENAFTTLAKCVQQVRDSNVGADEEALSLALGSIGSQLLLAAQHGTEWERGLLEHWIQHAPEMSTALITRADASYDRRITTDAVRSIFKKAPPPEFR